MQKYKITIRPDKIVEVSYHGDQSKEDALRLVDDLLEQIKDMPGEIDYLIDLVDVGKTTQSARQTVMKQLPKLRIKRQAIIGKGVFIKHLMNFMMGATGNRDKYRYFENREEAENWLSS